MSDVSIFGVWSDSAMLGMRDHTFAQQARRGLTSAQPVLNSKLVGGPGFEPGASRSRTVRPEVRLQGRIERAKALVTSGISLLPPAFSLDHLPHPHPHPPPL